MEINTLTNRSNIQKWELFMMVMKTKSIRYSSKRNYVKKCLKNELIRRIAKIERDHNQDRLADQYEYCKTKLNEIENQEIEGYIRRVKFLAPYEKSEADIAFYSKVEARKKVNGCIY